MKRTIALLALFLASPAACNSAPKGELMVHVQDASRNNISNATVWVGGFKNRSDTLKSTKKRGHTNGDGSIRLYGELRDIVYGINASKEGYYHSRKEVSVRSEKSEYKKEAIIILRKKINPVPMYAKVEFVKLPKRNTEFGFDFFKGDLVINAAKGQRKDVLLSAERPIFKGKGEEFEHTLKIGFPSDGDGIQFFDPPEYAVDSKFKSHYKAPEDGYKNEAKIVVAKSGSKRVRKNYERPAYIRIRSVVDDEGNFESAHYCKIYPGIILGGGWSEISSFKIPYICNPERNNRSMEYDVGSSLLPNLKGEEQIRNP